jgi:F-type H+-transporting ATPase subunit a
VTLPVPAAVVDLSITKSVMGMLVMMALMLLIFVSVARSYKGEQRPPKGLANFFEPLIIFIRDDIAVPSLGNRSDKFLPFLLTIFFFILFSNLLGLIPFIGGFNITGTIGVTLVLAVFVFILTTINGNRNYWGHMLWPSGIPFLVKLILVPIEVLSMFMKPTVLMIRLTSNVSAGHIIILSFVSLVFIFKQDFGAAAGHGIGIVSVAFMVFMYFLELLVAFLQAYVFTLLAAIYFGEATQEAHH